MSIDKNQAARLLTLIDELRAADTALCNEYNKDWREQETDMLERVECR